MSIRTQVMQAIESHPELPHHVLARVVADDIGDQELRALATERIERMIVAERRKQIREIEELATDISSARLGDPAKWAAVDMLLDEFRNAVIVNWTSDLLGSQFAVGDGQTVTWGQATAGQHLARIQLLTQNARGNLEAIRRHEAAIATIAERHAICLDEAVSVGAAI